MKSIFANFVMFTLSKGRVTAPGVKKFYLALLFASIAAFRRTPEKAPTKIPFCIWRHRRKRGAALDRQRAEIFRKYNLEPQLISHHRRPRHAVDVSGRYSVRVTRRHPRRQRRQRGRGYDDAAWHGGQAKLFFECAPRDQERGRPKGQESGHRYAFGLPCVGRTTTSAWTISDWCRGAIA